MIGQAIKAARKAAGFTQEDLANAIGVKRAVVSKYENGQIEPRYQTVERIASALHCDISDLVNTKKEAQMIIDQLCGINQEELTEEDEELLSDALEEQYGDAGSLAAQYVQFVTEHPHLMSMIENQGYVLNVKSWRTVEISHPDSWNLPAEISISSFLINLKALSASFDDMIRNVFAEEIGIKVEKESKED